MMAANRFMDRNGTHDPEQEKLAKEVQDCKDEAEKVGHAPNHPGLLPAACRLLECR